MTSTGGSVEFDPFNTSIPNLNAGTMSVTAAGDIDIFKSGIIAEGGSLSVHSGTSGTGDISFETTGASIEANSQTYQAGTGAGSTANADLVTNAPTFKNEVGTTAPTSFTLEQDATIDDSAIPAASQFFGSTPPSTTLPSTYTIQSDDGSVTLSTFSKVAGSALTLTGAAGASISGGTLGLSSLIVNGATDLNASVTAATQTYNSAVTLEESVIGFHDDQQRRRHARRRPTSPVPP